MAPATDGMTRSQALRTREFWLLVLIFAGMSFCLYGLLLHVVPLLTDRGMSPGHAAMAASTIGGTMIMARVVIGYLIDRWFAPWIAIVCFLLSAAGVATLAGDSGTLAAYAAMVCVGFSMGAETDLMAFLASRYFGLRHFGKIYGLLFSALLVGAALGPPAFGHAHDRLGDYGVILTACSAVIVLASLLTGMLPRYSRPG